MNGCKIPCFFLLPKKLWIEFSKEILSNHNATVHELENCTRFFYITGSSYMTFPFLLFRLIQAANGAQRRTSRLLLWLLCIFLTIKVQKVTVVIFSEWSWPSLTLGQVSWSPVTSHCSRRCHDTNRNRLDGSWEKKEEESRMKKQHSDNHCWSIIVVPSLSKCDRVKCIHRDIWIIQYNAEDTH